MAFPGGTPAQEYFDQIRRELMYLCEIESHPDAYICHKAMSNLVQKNMKDQTCHNLGQYYEKQANYEKAREFYEKNCLKSGDTRSCHKLATFMFRDLGGFQGKKAEGLEIFSENCLERGATKSCLAAGSILTFKKTENNPLYDPKKGHEYFLKGCELKEGESCHMAASIYYEGKASDIPVDSTNALKYFSLGCDLGFEESCKKAFTILNQGHNEVQRNKELARKFVEKSVLLKEKQKEQ